MRHPVGTRIYNRGDMANQSHWATITSATVDSFGNGVLTITPEDSDISPYIINAHMISDVDHGHGGTRLVTEEAYNALHNARMMVYARKTQIEDAVARGEDGNTEIIAYNESCRAVYDMEGGPRVFALEIPKGSR